jgi:hypothetical protein
MRRVLLHLGFHKTGTTSAQGFLRQNAPVIRKHYIFLGPGRTRPMGLTRAALAFTDNGTDAERRAFQSQLSHSLKQLSFGQARGLIISDENIGGRRPDQDLDYAYKHLPQVLEACIDPIKHHFAPEDCDIAVYLSTRDPQAWARSLWGHAVAKTHLSEAQDAFVTRATSVLSLNERVSAVRARLNGIPVRSERLEDLAPQPFGPGAPFADWLKAGPGDFSGLVPGQHLGKGHPAEDLDALHSLNRKIPDKTVLDLLKAERIAERKSKR